jgi:hypothetical protein
MRVRMMGLAGLLVATTACGDDGADPETFCAEAGPALVLLEEWVTEWRASLDPVGPRLGEAVEALEQPRPPSEISDEWESVVDSMVALDEVDRGDPDAVASTLSDVAAATSDLSAVQDYLGRSC